MIVLAGCRDAPSPTPGSPEYEEAVAAFYTGVAAIEDGADERAASALGRFVELAPRGPAGAANLALLAYQQRRFDEAASWVTRAVAGAPTNARIRILAALIEWARGQSDAAIEHIRRASETDASASRARFLLAQLLEQRSGPGDAEESRRVLDGLLDMESAGAFLHMYSARQAVRQGDAVALRLARDRLESLSASWPQPDRAGLERVLASIDRPADVGAELTLLAASLEALPGYVRDRDAITISVAQPDIVITEFDLLPAPSPRPAEPDLEMRFVARAIDTERAGVYDVRPIWTGDGGTHIAILGSDALWLAGDSAIIQAVPLPSFPPRSFRCQTRSGRLPAAFCLRVRAGTADDRQCG